MKEEIKYSVSWTVYDHISCKAIFLNRKFKTLFGALAFAWRMLRSGRDNVNVSRDRIAVVKADLS